MRSKAKQSVERHVINMLAEQCVFYMKQFNKSVPSGGLGVIVPTVNELIEDKFNDVNERMKETKDIL